MTNQDVLSSTTQKKLSPREISDQIKAEIAVRGFENGVSFVSETSPDGSFASITSVCRYNHVTEEIELLVLPYNPKKNRKGVNGNGGVKKVISPVELAAEGILHETGLVVKKEALIEFKESRDSIPDRDPEKARKGVEHIKHFFICVNDHSGELRDSWENEDPELGKPMWVSFEVLSQTDLLFRKHKVMLQKVRNFLEGVMRIIFPPTIPPSEEKTEE